jgi:hypothetical protein
MSSRPERNPPGGHEDRTFPFVILEQGHPLDDLGVQPPENSM